MVSVYLDQSAYSQFLNASPANWKEAPVAKVLLAAMASGEALVWASPTNVLETLQSDDRKKQLAEIMLCLTEAKRMWEGHEFTRIKDFLEFFNMLAPGFWREKEFYKHHSQDARRTWIGALALLACPQEFDLSGLVATAQKNKAISRLLHAQFAADPSRFIRYVHETVTERKTTNANPLAHLEKLTTEDIEAQIAALQTKFQKFGKKDLQVLNKNRAKWASMFGTIEIGRILQSIFDLPMELILMINAVPVVRNWPKIRKRLGCGTLPRAIAEASDHVLLADMDAIRNVLQETIFAAASAPLLSSAIGYEVIFRDLQRCINDKTIPTGGLAFDADHAAAIMCFNIFISNDRILVDSLKTLSKRLSEGSKGLLQPSIVTTAEELKKAIHNQQALSAKRIKHPDWAEEVI